MKKILFVFLVALAPAPGLAQEILDRPYYFVNGDDLTGVEQRGDRLYVQKCDSEFECDEKYQRNYKIWRAKQQGNRVLLEVERLDPVPGVDEPYPPDRFRLMGFIKENNNKVRFVNEAISVTKQELAQIPFEIAYLDEKFGFTYYSEDFLTSLDTEYELNKEEAEILMTDLRQNEEAIKYYNETVTGDVYRIAIAAELLSLELIEREICPIGGKEMLEKALLEEPKEEEVKEETNGDDEKQ